MLYCANRYKRIPFLLPSGRTQLHQPVQKRSNEGPADMEPSFVLDGIVIACACSYGFSR